MTDSNGTCPICGQTFNYRTNGRHRKYCSNKCARKGYPSEQMVTTKCVICGTSVKRTKRNAEQRDTLCGKKCEAEYKGRRMRKPKSVLPEDHPARWILGQLSIKLRYYECIDCGQLACYDARWFSARRCARCRKPRVARFVSCTCIHCGCNFVADKQAFTSHFKFCSDICSAKHHRSRRRARKRKAYVQDVVRPYIFKRDGYRCQICGKKLAMKKQVPHPKAPTIDHIIPLAQGGTHEPSNAQAAHFICNAKKSDNCSADQLLLIG